MQEPRNSFFHKLSSKSFPSSMNFPHWLHSDPRTAYQRLLRRWLPRRFTYGSLRSATRWFPGG